MGIFDKTIQVFDGWLDDRLEKAKASSAPSSSQPGEGAYDRKGLIEIEYGSEQQWGWKEKRGLVGPQVLKNMARKDSIVAAILQTRVNQVSQFAQPQTDRYSPGFRFIPVKTADLSREDKLKLGDPELSEEDYEKLKYDLEKKRSKLQAKEDEEIEKLQTFVLHCGVDPYEVDTTYIRCDFDKCVKLWVWDRLVYNYTGTELIPNKLRTALHHWYPVSAGTIKYVSRRSAEQYEKTIKEALKMRFARLSKDFPEVSTPEAAYEKEKNLPFRYVQVIRGRVEAAWTEAEMIFEAAQPTIDPEDNGYAPGELELLTAITTAHLYAEAHNRNYFTQGIGSKGILHIKGQNISRGQLEGFKRQWFNQLASSRNAFRPPIIGLADEVKWIELAQSNKDMEFDNWMNYLIKVMCAIFQMDPAEINFDITKNTTSTLNEANNEERMKSSKDKGLRPLLNYIENLLNRYILPQWDKDLAARYKFRFVGLDAETREQEMKRLETETKVWKTLNEARVEMGRAPIEHGDVVLNATYTQYLQMKDQAKQQEEQGLPGEGQPGELTPPGENPEKSPDAGGDADSFLKELDQIDKQVDKEVNGESKEESKKEEPATKAVIEYIED